MSKVGGVLVPIGIVLAVISGLGSVGLMTFVATGKVGFEIFQSVGDPLIHLLFASAILILIGAGLQSARWSAVKELFED